MKNLFYAILLSTALSVSVGHAEESKPAAVDLREGDVRVWTKGSNTGEVFAVVGFRQDRLGPLTLNAVSILYLGFKLTPDGRDGDRSTMYHVKEDVERNYLLKSTKPIPAGSP